MKDEKTEPKLIATTLSPKLGGGPKGLGDPDDNSLRKVELDVLIPQKIRDRTRAEKCTEVVADFTRCCKESGVFMVFQCRKENTALKSCLEKWYYNEDFVNECKQEYLRERSEYRRTGISPKAKTKRLQSN